MQPIEKDDRGVLRFKRNELVRQLLDYASVGRQCDMNTLALMQAPDEDRRQFAQLIGYSLCGYGDLSYVRTEDYDQAELVAQSKDFHLDPKDARIKALEDQLEEYRKLARSAIEKLDELLGPE